MAATVQAGLEAALRTVDPGFRVPDTPDADTDLQAQMTVAAGAATDRSAVRRLSQKLLACGGERSWTRLIMLVVERARFHVPSFIPRQATARSSDLRLGRR